MLRESLEYFEKALLKKYKNHSELDSVGMCRKISFSKYNRKIFKL